jgi:hypothetical protein
VKKKFEGFFFGLPVKPWRMACLDPPLKMVTQRSTHVRRAEVSPTVPVLVLLLHSVSLKGLIWGRPPCGRCELRAPCLPLACAMARSAQHLHRHLKTPTSKLSKLCHTVFWNFFCASKINHFKRDETKGSSRIESLGLPLTTPMMTSITEFLKKLQKKKKKTVYTCLCPLKNASFALTSFYCSLITKDGQSTSVNQKTKSLKEIRL